MLCKILSMRINKPNLKLFLSILFVAAILCFCQSASAQSGRRLPKPAPILQAVQPSVTTETANSDETKEQPEKIEYLLIVGDIQNDDSYSDTILLNSTLDYCSRKLENQPSLKLKVEAGGRANFKEAQERAKKVKNVYILWIDFVLENLGKGKTQVKYANFTILEPKSAQKLFTGRIDPEKLSKNGGVRGAKQSASEAAQIDNIGEEIIYRLLRWGWLN